MSSSFSKGTASLSIATMMFFGVSSVLQIIMTHFFDDVAYGSLSVVLNLLNTLEYVFAAGLSQSLTKFLAERPTAGKSIIHRSLVVQIVISLAIMIVLATLAPSIAGWTDKQEIATYVWIIVLIIPFYSARSFIQGILGGQQEFSAQAKTKVVIALAKFVLVLAALFLGADVFGVLVAYLLAGLVGALYGKAFIRPIQHQEELPLKEFLSYSASLTAFLVIFPLFLNLDVFLVELLAHSEAEVGLYASASNLARMPFYLFTGLLLTLLPSVARLHQTSASELQRVVREVIRYALILLLPIAVITASTAEGLQPLILGQRFAEGAGALKILIIAISVLVLFRVCSTILTGIMKPHAVTIVTGVMILADVLLNIFLIPRFGMLGAASATLIVSSIGFVVVWTWLRQKVDLTISARTIGNLLLASLILGILGRFTHTGALLVVELVGLTLVYTALLWIFGELQKKDLDRILRLFQRHESHEEV